MTDSTPEAAPSRDRFITLGDEQDMLTVRQANTEPPADTIPFIPFQIPALPLSYEVWACRLLETMQTHYERAMATVLMLDCQRRRWWHPIMPRQQCRQDGVAWQLSAADFAVTPPEVRVAGSVQSGMLADDDEIESRLPPFDGLHLYLGLCTVQPGYRRWFLRTQGEVRSVPQMCVVFDDWRTMLIACQHKLSRSDG